MGNPFDIVVSVEKNIALVFQSFKTFVLGLDLTIMTIGLFLIILLFFIIIAALVYIPVKLYPYYKENERIFKKVFHIINR